MRKTFCDRCEAEIKRGTKYISFPYELPKDKHDENADSNLRINREREVTVEICPKCLDEFKEWYGEIKCFCQRRISEY